MSTPNSFPPGSSDKETSEDALRPHVYDGIQEYDKRLPRWWLLTLYGAIVFGFLYWGYYHTYGLGLDDERQLRITMMENTLQASKKSGVLDDDLIWRLSKDSARIAAGKTTFETTCAACHKADLSGLIGPNLKDHEWIHGGKPMEVMHTIETGVLNKGMPAWGSILGKEKITDVAAYIFSHHTQGEPIIPVAGWTPGAAPTP
jgi:cytochrome c oxidase cbb3-type subunit 3